MPRRDYDDDDDRYGRGARDDDRPRDRRRDEGEDDRRDRQYDDDDDYDDDYDRRPRRRRYVEPHRGTLILILGILGFVVCALCAPAAWIMGGQDLAKMRAGEMDYAGYSETQIGYVLGIIGTLLIGLGILIVFFIFAVIVKN